jgi:transposase-like protein
MKRSSDLYAAGLSTRDIRAHLEEVYGLRVSADLISRVTVKIWEVWWLTQFRYCLLE